MGREEVFSDTRPIVYCLLPSALAPALHGLLRRHFRDDPGVEIVVERRTDERRAVSDRRSNVASRGDDDERRRIRSSVGRRLGERRATLVPVSAKELPRKARPFFDRLVFVERLEPAGQALEDLDTARLVMRIQAGDRDAFAVLYMRYFDRTQSYLRIVLRNAHDAEDATQQVFLKLFGALPRYQFRNTPFRAWLFTIARNEAMARLGDRGRSSVVEPDEIDRQRDAALDTDLVISALDWISDRDLMLFVERLPLAQRQVLLLRYMHDLPYAEIAAILERSPNEVRKLQQRATSFLRARLAAVSSSSYEGRACHWRRRPTFLGVARARRFALLP
jgi:RNA polymerase sigma-70 factor (ECF subfamily)